jgi:hypothetical protein
MVDRSTASIGQFAGPGGEPNALARGCYNATRPELTLRRVHAVA